MLGTGIYTLTEAGHFAGVSDSAARAWFQGWPRSQAGPVLQSDYAGLTDRRLVSFLDFTDLVVVASLRRVKAPMRSIRRAYNQLKSTLDSEHPFSRSELYADTVGNLFLRAATDAGDDQLVEVLKSQGAFPSILLPFLKRIDYDPQTNLARRYDVADGVVLDAQRSYGKPITVASAMPTSVLARAYLANRRDAEAVADWYGVGVQEVQHAVKFEQELKNN